MLSHDFARALLERRNHDLRFVTEVCFPGHDDEEGETNRTQMADDRMRSVSGAGNDVEVLKYDSQDDILDVMLGPIFTGQQGGYTLSPEEVQRLLRILSSLQLGAESMALRERLREATE